MNLVPKPTTASHKLFIESSSPQTIPEALNSNSEKPAKARAREKPAPAPVRLAPMRLAPVRLEPIPPN